MASRVILVFLSLAALVFVGFSDCLSNLNTDLNTNNEFSSSKLSGINLSPAGFEFQYSNNADFQNYGLLSSYTCCDTVNRPESLWIVDGMLNIQQQIGITIQNVGSTASGQFDLRVYIEHNEYDEFIIFDQVVQVSSISGSSSKTLYLNFIPDYAGNHTINAVTQHPQDDDVTNDKLSRHYTIGNLYENANSGGIWTSMSSYWSIDTGTGISPHDSSTFYRNSFYVGDTSTVTYGNNWNEVMDSSVIDFSDRVSNPNKAFQISFLASGASKSGDNLYLKIQNSPGAWKTLGTLNAVIDSSAANWNLFNYNINPNDMNSNGKLRLNFISNTVNTDSGYWIDDFVMVYDQAARDTEYSPNVLSFSNGQSSAEEWSEHDVEVLNGGNLEDKLSFEITNLPTEWDWSINYKDGGPIDPLLGIEVGKGKSKNLTVRVKPSSNSSLGETNLNFKVSSKNSLLSSDSKEFELDVLPTYLPVLQFNEELGLCKPGTNCEFYATLTNGGDVSDSFKISSDILILRNGWSFDLSWNQQKTISLESGESVPIMMTVDVPFDSITGQYSSLLLTVTSDSREDISSAIRINASASMISLASFSVEIVELAFDVINPLPGSIIELPFTLWNNAATFDTFEVCIVKSGSRSWIVESEHIGMIIDDEGDCSNPYVFDVPGYTSLGVNVIIEIPENSQSGDSGPLLSPIIRSLRSDEIISSIPFNGLSVRMISDLKISDLESHMYLSPGSENILTFNISNDGNGLDQVAFTVENLVYEWEYWFSDGDEIIENYVLSPGYEGNDVAMLYLHIFVPEDFLGETSINFEISLISILYDTEIDFSDNKILYSGITAMSFIPEWIFGPTDSIITEADTVIELNATIINSGNAFDDHLKVKFELESSNQNSEISAVLRVPTFSEDYFSSGQWASTPLGNGQLARIEIILMIPPDTIIPSELKISWYIQGGSNQLGESVMLTNITLVDVSIYRSLSAELGIVSGIVSPSTIEYFSINLSSSSSIIEDLTLEYIIPDNWYLFCEDPPNDGELRIVIPASISGSSRKARLDCSLQIGEGSGLNEFQLNLLDADGNNLYSWTLELAVEGVSEESMLSSFFAENKMLKGLMLTFGGIIFVLLGIITIQRMSENYDSEEDLGTLPHNYQDSNSEKQQYSQQHQTQTNPITYQTQQNQQTIVPVALPITQALVSNFSQPSSRPPSEIETPNLQDAFGSLMSANLPEDENK